MAGIDTVALVGLAPLILLIAMLGVTALRSRAQALGAWLLAWAALLTSAWFVLWVGQVPELQPISYLFGSLVTPFMLLGTHEHVGRRAPGWILPLGFVVGVVRMACFLGGMPEVAHTIAAIVDPLLVLRSAWLVIATEARRPTRFSTGEGLLGLAFLAYAFVEVADSRLRYLGGVDRVDWALWIVGALPLFATQTALHLHRLGRAAAAHDEASRSFDERLRILTHATRDLIVDFDESGTIHFASASAGLVGGTDAEDLIGRNVRRFLFDPTLSPITRQLVTKGRISEEDVRGTSTLTFPVQASDGSLLWYESEIAPYRTPDHRLHVLVRARDVTERHRAELEAAERERRLNRTEQLASVGSWEFDPAAGSVHWSAEHFRLFGLTPRTTPLSVREIAEQLVVGEDGRPCIRSAEDAPTPGPDGPFDLECRIRRADDGAVRTLRVVAEIHRDEQGGIERLTGASIDLTERIELEEKLRRGQEHFRTLVDANIVGVFFGYPDGRLSDANEAFLGPLGYSRADLPLDWKALTPPGLEHRDATAIEQIRLTGTAQPFEREFLAKSGARIPMLVAATRIRGGLVLVIAQDLSERKRAEAYIARYQKQLEETVAERTRELLDSRARLIEAERLAAIGTLAAGVAHQINNPIGAILNSAEYALLCRAEPDSAATFEHALRTNLDEARRCARIVRSMLQFARDEPTAKWVEELGRILRRAHRAITPYANDRSTRVALHTPDTPVHVRVSPIEIEQALVNVLRNAIESRAEGGTVALCLETRDKQAIVEVVDDGRGIAAEDRERVFDPFYSTRTRDGGTGLGLSVAHGIVTDHGGTIRIDSEPGEGTRVVISLPLAEDEPAPSEPARRPDGAD